MGKPRLVAETGAGQHGVATATAAALLGMECLVYMGEVDMARQELNVFRMRLLGAEVTPGRCRAAARSRTRSTRPCATGWPRSRHSHYCLGSVMGPHPYPWMVRELHRVIGNEARAQCRGARPAALPDVVVACVGGGSNAIGHLLRLRRRPERRAGGRRAGRRRRGRPRRARHRARHEVATCCRTSSARSRRPSRSRPGSTTPASGPSTPTWPTSAGPATSRSPTTRSSTPSCCCSPHRGHHPGPGVGPRPGLGRPGSGRRWPGGPCW